MSDFQTAALRQIATIPGEMTQAKDAFIREMEQREGCATGFPD